MEHISKYLNGICAFLKIYDKEYYVIKCTPTHTREMANVPTIFVLISLLRVRVSTRIQTLHVYIHLYIVICTQLSLHSSISYIWFLSLSLCLSRLLCFLFTKEFTHYFFPNLTLILNIQTIHVCSHKQSKHTHILTFLLLHLYLFLSFLPLSFTIFLPLYLFLSLSHPLSIFISHSIRQIIRYSHSYIIYTYTLILFL